MIMKHCILLKPFRVSVIHTRMNQLQWNWNKFNPLKNGEKGNVIQENIIVPKKLFRIFLGKVKSFQIFIFKICIFDRCQNIQYEKFDVFF